MGSKPYNGACDVLPAHTQKFDVADPRVLKLAIYFDISGTVLLAADSPIEEGC